MFLTITPNPCIERTATVPDFVDGSSIRIYPEQLEVNAGGKGINASRVAAACGAPTLALAWAGRHQRDWLTELLNAEGVPHQLVPTDVNTRITYNLITAAANTELVEAGQPLSIEDGTRLFEAVQESLDSATLVALCGSYPPATDAAFHMHATVLARIVAKAGKQFIYDGKGPAFEMAVRSSTPIWLIKPNLDEAAALLHRTIEGPAEERKAAKDLRRHGVENVILSCGSRGAYLATGNGVEFFQSPEVGTVSPVGSGDSLVGAFAAKYLETGKMVESVAYGIAAGAANAAQLKPAFVQMADIEALLPQVKRKTQEISLAFG